MIGKVIFTVVLYQYRFARPTNKVFSPNRHNRFTFAYDECNLGSIPFVLVCHGLLHGHPRPVLTAFEWTYVFYHSRKDEILDRLCHRCQNP